MRAVADAGPLIHLSWIDHVDLLGQLFEEVLVPGAVREEVLRAAPDVPGMEAIRAAFAAGQLEVRAIDDQTQIATLPPALHQGEAQALVLLRQEDADLLLTDDRRARAEAERRGIPLTGTIGLLQEARQRGLIPAAYPLVLRLRASGFRISPRLLERIEREERETRPSMP